MNLESSGEVNETGFAPKALNSSGCLLFGAVDTNEQLVIVAAFDLANMPEQKN